MSTELTPDEVELVELAVYDYLYDKFTDYKFLKLLDEIEVSIMFRPVLGRIVFGTQVVSVISVVCGTIFNKAIAFSDPSFFDLIDDFVNMVCCGHEIGDDPDV